MPVRLALVGDSIAWGKGAAREEDRLAARLAGGLEAAGIAVTTRTVAVSGARSAGLGAQVDRVLPWQPQVAVVVIGANDLTHRVPAEEAVSALAEAVGRLRAADVEVVVAPAPDLSAVPHVPEELRPAVRRASRRLREQQVAAVTAAGCFVADADGHAAARFHTEAGLFSTDRFHPSSAGYAVIAEGLLPAVLAAARRVTGS